MCIYVYIVISKKLNFCHCPVTMQRAIVVVTDTYTMWR